MLVLPGASLRALWYLSAWRDVEINPSRRRDPVGRETTTNPL